MKKKLWIFYIFLSVFTLPLLVLSAQKAQNYLSRAADVNANIDVDWNNQGSSLETPWRALAQGGEEIPPMLKSVVKDVKALQPSYIRLDHIFDLYAEVSKENGVVKIDFRNLDDSVKDILSTGALPMLSLSYTPGALSTNGKIDGPPDNWNDWSEMVRQTVERYSSKNGMNLSNVYYEVWNEPDLFGGYKVTGEPDYRFLYQQSVSGAQAAVNTNPFMIGGPATTGMYTNWIDKLLLFCQENNIRIDFISWHRYTNDPNVFNDDYVNAKNVISRYPKYNSLPLLITEWGIDAEINPFYDNNVSAAYTIASIRQMIDKIKYAFSFEIKDGPGPNNQAFWGRWGLITHDLSGLYKKPRYNALLLLNKLSGKSIPISGEGTHVSGIAARDGDSLVLILTNYDPSGLHSENVPVTFKSLDDASYTLITSYLNGTEKTNEYAVTTGSLSESIIMNPNDVVSLTLTRNSSLAAFTVGVSGQLSDQALFLNKELIFPAPVFGLSQSGSIAFDYKPGFDWNLREDKIIMEAP